MICDRLAIAGLSRLSKTLMDWSGAAFASPGVSKQRAKLDADLGSKVMTLERFSEKMAILTQITDIFAEKKFIG
jgi:hypothetical protein